MGDLKAHASDGCRQERHGDRLGAARGCRTLGGGACRPPTTRTSARGIVATKDFLGDYLDFHVRVGDVVARWRRRIRRCARRPATDPPAHEGGEMRRDPDRHDGASARCCHNPRSSSPLTVGDQVRDGLSIRLPGCRFRGHDNSSIRGSVVCGPNPSKTLQEKRTWPKTPLFRTNSPRNSPPKRTRPICAGCGARASTSSARTMCAISTPSS